MTRYAMLGAAMISLLGGTGCYYDQWQDCQTALRTTQEDLSRAKTDLLDCEHMNKQKDTQIDALRNQVGTLEQANSSLNAENSTLREALAKAQAIMEKNAGAALGQVNIINRELPREVANALQKLADDFPGVLEFDPKTGAVRWKADLLFPLGSDQVSTNAQIQEALRRFAEIVKSPAASQLDLVIVGHTDTTPIRKAETLKEHKTNWHLSAHRAIAVMRMLADLAVRENRMGVMGYGEHRPISDNTTTEGKTRNRRVEIFLVNKDSVQGVSGATGVYESPEAGGAFVKPSDTDGRGGAAAPAPRRAAPARGAARPAAPPAAPPADPDAEPADSSR